MEKGDLLHGYYFYNSTNDSEINHVFGNDTAVSKFVIHNDHIFGMVELTLDKAIAKMQQYGVDPIKNFNMSISVYPMI